MEMRLRRFGDAPSPLARLKMVQIHNGNQSPRRPLMAVPDEQTPGWAQGLRELYQGVAEEPMPSDFGDLLARLDRRSVQHASH